MPKRYFEDVVHVRIIRPNFDNGLTEEQKNHPSETALDGYRPDILVVNDGTLNDLYNIRVRELCEQLYNGIRTENGSGLR